jgi:hypothetical protein
VQTTNGIADISINSWKTPGAITVRSWVVNVPTVASQSSVITVVSGPPTFGYVDRNDVGVMLGAGMWEIEWAAHFWDQFSNDVRDSTAVYFHSEPEDICSITGGSFTGNQNRNGETFPGIAYTTMIYSSGTIGDTLERVEACCAGLVPDPQNPDTLLFGDLCVPYMTINGIDTSFQYILPFQPGDQAQPLALNTSVNSIVFPHPSDQGGDVYYDIACQATIVDGYGNPVHNQLIFFYPLDNLPYWEWIPEPFPGSPYDPNGAITNDQGQCEKVIRIHRVICENMHVPCGDTDEDQFAPASISLWCRREPGGPNSNVVTISIEVLCPDN